MKEISPTRSYVVAAHQVSVDERAKIRLLALRIVRERLEDLSFSLKPLKEWDDAAQTVSVEFFRPRTGTYRPILHPWSKRICHIVEVDPKDADEMRAAESLIGETSFSEAIGDDQSIIFLLGISEDNYELTDLERDFVQSRLGGRAGALVLQRGTSKPFS